VPEQWAEKWGLLYPFLWGAGSTSNTVWQGPRPTSIPSGILIHPTVWPRYTNVTDRQIVRQTDNGPIAWGEQFSKRSPKNSSTLLWSVIYLFSKFNENPPIAFSLIPLTSRQKDKVANIGQNRALPKVAEVIKLILAVSSPPG